VPSSAVYSVRFVCKHYGCERTRKQSKESEGVKGGRNQSKLISCITGSIAHLPIARSADTSSHSSGLITIKIDTGNHHFGVNEM